MNDQFTLWRSGCTSLLLSWTVLFCANTSCWAQSDNFEREQLIAWCIVPFDALERTPAQRAQMLEELGLRRVAYDWREKHVAEFETEILQYQQHGLEYFAFWGEHEEAFQLFEKHDLHPQIWKMLPQPAGDSDEQRLAAAVQQILPLVKRTQSMGCKLGIYNHGGWSGNPKNMVAICEALHQEHQAKHVGIVYNLHHGHEHISDFKTHLAAMQPFLHCLNLNGMTADGEEQGKKILPLGAGEMDLQLVKQILKSGYEGPIGILGHTQDDVELRLRDNLTGLEWILQQLKTDRVLAKPTYSTYP